LPVAQNGKQSDLGNEVNQKTGLAEEIEQEGEQVDNERSREKINEKVIRLRMFLFL
jgi:hypothetical protein